MKKVITRGFLILILIFLIFRFTCGIFVIQPIGAVPKGSTIVYWRIGTNFPFISSVDGLLIEKGQDVSLLGRGMMLAAISEPIVERKIMTIPYSESLYLWSTGGKLFSK